MDWHYPKNDDYPPEYTLCFSDWVIAEDGKDIFPAILELTELQWFKPTWPLNPLSPDTFMKCSAVKWKPITKEGG